MPDFKQFSDDELRALVRDNNTYAEISRAAGVKICGASKAVLATRIISLNIDTSHFISRKTDKLSKTSDADFTAHVRIARSWPEVALLCGYDVGAYGHQQRVHIRTLMMRRATELGLDADHIELSTRASNRRIFVSDSTANRSQVKRRLLRDLRWPYKCNACHNIMFEHRDGKPFWFDKPVTLQLEHRNGISTDNRLENLEFLCPLCHSQTTTYSGGNSVAARAKRARELAQQVHAIHEQEEDTKAQPEQDRQNQNTEE
jgi:hypothetical protein